MLLYIASFWKSRFQHNGVSARLPSTKSDFFFAGVHPLMSTAPRSIVESANIGQENKGSMETQRSVILDPKDDYLVLDDIKVVY